MFVFSSVLSASLWFLVRWVHNLLLPSQRNEPRTFWRITLIAALLATVAAWLFFRTLFSPFAGWFAAATMAPLYIGLCVALRALLRVFQQPPPEQ